jgi:hypothetical protein
MACSLTIPFDVRLDCDEYASKWPFNLVGTIVEVERFGLPPEPNGPDEEFIRLLFDTSKYQKFVVDPITITMAYTKPAWQYFMAAKKYDIEFQIVQANE